MNERNIDNNNAPRTTIRTQPMDKKVSSNAPRTTIKVKPNKDNS